MKAWRGAEPIGELRGWLVLALAAEQLANGSWRYTYSVAPGVHVTLDLLPDPDMVAVTDPIYLEVLRGIRVNRAERPRQPAVPDPGLS